MGFVNVDRLKTAYSLTLDDIQLICDLYKRIESKTM